jgi:hypothetical protein
VLAMRKRSGVGEVACCDYCAGGTNVYRRCRDDERVAVRIRSAIGEVAGLWFDGGYGVTRYW